MAIDDLNELLGTELPEGDWDTVGGLVYGLLGHVPTEGETVEIGGNHLTAERVQGRRIGRVRVTTPSSDLAAAPDAVASSDSDHDRARS
jgi:Mg2+/Co2+ transporter CorC